MKKIRVGSRESKLAVIQTQIVMDAIKRANPEIEVELVTMKTTGDIILDKTLDKIGGKGLFVKELDKAMLDGGVDITVHSFKDMPMDIPSELPIVATGRREDPRDVLILPQGASEIDFSKPIGSSSARRSMQLKKLYPGADIKSVRGNVITRLEKLDRGEYSALVLAAAGVKRLGLDNRISRYFTPEEMIPANCQGVIVVQARKGFDVSLLGDFACKESWITTLCERAFVKELDGGCSAPIAAHSNIEGDEVVLTGMYVCQEDYERMKRQEEAQVASGNRIITVTMPRVHKKTVRAKIADAQSAAVSLAQDLKKESECMKTGKVTLVGAGPGDKGLLTLKGKERIEQAEVVIYDRLIGDGILGLIPKDALRINVGKKANHHLVPQSEINRLILEHALCGKRVVRLKGGDGFLFGRGGEELELLHQHEIDFEVVPGITSAISVPAYAGIPVTHRDCCSSVHIITGHAKAGTKIDIDYKSLVAHKGTLVFLMGLTAIEELMKGLIEAGMDPQMPAATVEKGTSTNQRKVVSTISELASEVRLRNIQSPAITIVGTVCALSDKFDWFTKKPLHGSTIVVTRPKDRIGTIADRLRDQGADVIEYPCIETAVIEDNPRLEKAIEDIRSYSWMVFTSPAGVESFFEKLSQMRLDIRIFFGLKIAAVGRETKKRLEDRNLLVDYMPQTYDAPALSAGLAEIMEKEDKVLILRADKGSDVLPKTLEQHQIEYDDVHIYETSYVCNESEAVREKLDAGKISYITFTSASTVTGFTQSILRDFPEYDFTKVKAICIGEQTAAEARKYDMRIHVAREATMDAMIEEIEILHRIESNTETGK